MKVMYNDNTENMFYEYAKYSPGKPIPISKLIYKNKVESFMRKLNELEKEYNMCIVADYALDYDSMIESQLLLYDETYGLIGEIHEVDEEDN